MPFLMIIKLCTCNLLYHKTSVFLYSSEDHNLFCQQCNFKYKLWQTNNQLYNIIKLRSKLTKVILIIRMLHYCPLHLLYTGQLPYWTVTSSIATSPCSVLAWIKIWGAKFLFALKIIQIFFTMKFTWIWLVILLFSKILRCTFKTVWYVFKIF